MEASLKISFSSIVRIVFIVVVLRSHGSSCLAVFSNGGFQALSGCALYKIASKYLSFRV